MNKTTSTVASVAFMATRDQKQRLVELGYKKKAEIDKMTPQQIQDTLKLHDLGHSRAEIAAMTPDQAHVFLLAHEHVESGLSLIPIGANSKTTPEGFSWKIYQRRRATDDELRVWVSKYLGLGIVGGKVSGKNGAALEILDLESIAPLDEFRNLADETAPGLLDRLPRTKTPTGGRHVYYRCEIVEGNQKLAQRAEEIVDADLPRTDDGAIDKETIKKDGLREIGGKYFKIRTLIETRGEGGQVLSPLCLPGTHPNGGVYQLINGDLRDIPTITIEERDILLTAARACNEWIDPAKIKGSREAANHRVEGLKPGADYNTQSDAAEKSRGLLKEYGWTLFRSDSRGELWSRPGVTDHCSARLFNNGVLHVFSTNATPFNGSESYTPFGVYAELKHDGDYSAAAKVLAGEGYGTGRRNAATQAQGQANSNGAQQTNGATGSYACVTMSEVTPEKIEWLWKNYLAMGKITLLDGQPGIGKSWLTCQIAAIVTRGGEFPDGAICKPGKVLMFSAEDGLADTMWWRLEACGADLSKVIALNFLEKDGLAVFDQKGLIRFEETIIQHSPSIVIVDPLFAFTGGAVDIHRANECREVSRVLAAICARRRCNMLCVRHLNKSGGNGDPMKAGIGSIDWLAAARVGLMAGCDPDEKSKLALTIYKSNIGRKGMSFGYRLTFDPVTEEGSFEWTGESTLSADRICSPAHVESLNDTNERTDAEKFLRKLLAGGPVDAAEVETGRKANQIPDYQIRKARIALGIVPYKVGNQHSNEKAKWVWELPVEGVETAP